MLRSLELESRRYSSFGECIFCGSKHDLTDEHVVPEFLSGSNEILIEHGSCESCNNYANKNYEQPAAKADLLPVRLMLSLRRKKRGKKARILQMPPVSFTATNMEGGEGDFSETLPPENYPPLFEFIIHPPAGLLIGEDRSAGSKNIKIGILHLGKRGITPNAVATRHPHVMGAPEFVVAKMAYCYAVAERGLHFMDLSGLRNLLMGTRDDVFNFVGSPLHSEDHPRTRLHRFYFRERGGFSTVLVHLFSSFGGPVYEVVLGERP